MCMVFGVVYLLLSVIFKFVCCGVVFFEALRDRER
jgi:hypothetical protein